MNVIRILHEKVASQIAAGEVIERPSSVVRELIDNSIDAGAGRITVRIEKGGKGLVKVSDNGVGMSRDDVLLSVERHATSKIENASDLFSVKSLGFRGEALPSIASVSRMQITSRPHDQLAGYKLRITGGKLATIEETGAPPGTTVEVRDLFFNIPARRKFLRATRTESEHIIDVLSRVALPFSGINFRLEDTGKTLMNLRASDHQLLRLSGLIGGKVAESMIEVQEKNHDLAIRAFLGPPELSRSRGDRLFVYVNNRNIRDRLVTKAIMEGYGKRLMKGRYPQTVLFIEIDPSKVDVNVHPTKQEVRFHNSAVLFRFIAATIENALAQHFHGILFPGAARDMEGSLDQGRDSAFVSEPSWSYSPLPQDMVVPRETEVHEQSMVKEIPQVIGQLKNTYILCQAKDGLLMVDQHAAHERVVYERLKKGFSSSRIEAQALLLPRKVELSLKEKRIVLDKGDQLSRVGIDLDHFGDTTFVLRSVPELLKSAQWDSFLSELIAELGEGELEEDTVLDKVLTLMACHGALRAGHHMSQEEMAGLIGQLEEVDVPTHCPHGRPTFKHFTYYEIEKIFKRIV